MKTQKIREALKWLQASDDDLENEVKQADLREALAEADAIDAPPPLSAKRSCNLHIDCDAADVAAVVVGRSCAIHCNDADCSDHQ